MCERMRDEKAHRESDSKNPAGHTRTAGDTAANSARDWLLCRGIRSLLECDGAEAVEGIARFIISQDRYLQAGAEWVERERETSAPAVIALLDGVMRFLEIGGGNRRGGAVWIARLGNERRAVETLPPLLPELFWSELKFRGWPDASAFLALARNLGSDWQRVLRLARRLHHRYEFFKVLRVVELICYYSRYLGIFHSGRYCLAVTSNHSNPHGIAFNLAARKCGVPVALITHGMPVRPVARLSYDLAVVHCEAARQTYLDGGCRIDRVLIHGRKQHYQPMPAGPLPERLTVGIFLCKDVNEKRMRLIVERILGDSRVSRILVRLHPKNLWKGAEEWVSSRGKTRLRLSPGGTVFQDIKRSDIVLAGNSSVLVEAVTAGRPSGYVSDMDYGSPDLHEFVSRGLICPIDNDLNFDPEAMFRFYRRPDWPDVLRLFANIDEDEATVAAQICAAIRDLAVLRDQSSGPKGSESF